MSTKSLIGKEFWGCEKIVSSTLLGYFFFGCYLIQLPGIYIKEITNWIPFFRIIGALTVIIASILLIPIFGSVGAAYSIVLAFFFMSLSINIKLKNIYPISYNWKGFFLPLTFLIMVQFGEIDNTLRFLLCFIFPITWYLLVLSENQKIELKRVIK